ncbi:hypothetical protein BDP81DRAFT_415827 [Colletotrichum phormii]|uniref:Uncharacterized protein n=1 Tax=Colletotrichum phormii TaxID=359342 RepID=A0AAJ0A148_9PEZI|nr:uncharacterized protein BDP81DRAFT_415827 [Colletotrichum phormii]KAK1654486.1 hypothetical protein BDP81DRAFT_415827 [Colletotrichum phormii]
MPARPPKLASIHSKHLRSPLPYVPCKVPSLHSRAVRLIVFIHGGLGFRSVLTASSPIARPSIPLAQPFPPSLRGPVRLVRRPC